MIYILEEFSTYDDTWKMTFYFVFAVAILLGLFWTLYQMFKKENMKNNNLKENTIYNKPYDAIEDIDILPKRKNKDDKIINYYDVYQNENKQQNQSIIEKNEESRGENKLNSKDDTNDIIETDSNNLLSKNSVIADINDNNYYKKTKKINHKNNNYKKNNYIKKSNKVSK